MMRLRRGYLAEMRGKKVEGDEDEDCERTGSGVT